MSFTLWGFAPIANRPSIVHFLSLSLFDICQIVQVDPQIALSFFAVAVVFHLYSIISGINNDSRNKWFDIVGTLNVIG
jgi:uncharacterized paraquat-inducible protein A